LVWDETSLFKDRIEAWAGGPVVPEMYKKHRGKFKIDAWDGDPKKLSKDARETIEAVVGHYGKFTAQQLSDLTHSDEPWRLARKGLAPGERGNQEITRASMHEFYSGLN
jgi:uncharacterized phage-associated protein